MQKQHPISRCPSHFMPFQSEIESKTAYNQNATQCIPQIAIPTPSPPTLPFSQSAAPSFSHYTHSTRISPPRTLLPILQHLSLINDPIPFSSHSHSKTHKTAHFLQLPILLPLPNLFIPLPAPIQQSPPICFQSQNLPSHHHQHSPTNSPHPSSPIPQSISNSPPKEKKTQHTHSPPSISLLLSIQKKAKQCIFTTSRFTNRRWCNARSMVGAVCADVMDIGNFSSPKTEEFIISRGNIIELWRLDESGNVNVICSYEVYGLIRSLKPFRLSGTIQSTSLTRRKRHGFHSHRLGQWTHRGTAVQRRNERL